MEIKNICCIGAGFVGGPTMAVIADKCPNIQVNVVDINKEKINNWNNVDLSNLPVYEPGLEEKINKCRGKNLHFSCDIKENIKIADVVFISVNTPTKEKGIGAGKASDLKWVEASARQVALYSEGYTIVVEKSTLPVRTAEVIKTILEASSSTNINPKITKKFDVLSNPEFLAEGSAINDLEFPDRVLIGGENKYAIDKLNELYRNWIPEEKIINTTVWSSELSKLTANAFLAQRVSSINSISAICEETGADVREVANAIGTDNRIGNKFLNSGPGFGGSCFKKDILNLVYLCEYFDLKEVAEYWYKVIEINNWQQNRITNLITKKLFGTLFNKKIIILGFAFKSKTNDTRESPAINVCKNLLEEGARLFIHDPKVNTEQIEKELGQKEIIKENNEFNECGRWTKINDLDFSFNKADAVIILTEWDDYKEIDWPSCSKLMRHPSWVFDTRSITNPNNIRESGVNYWRIGDGTI